MSRAVLIGIFDGVHKGHQELLKIAETKGEVVALTFYPHPTSVLAPERTPRELIPLPDRVKYLKEHGAKSVEVIEFTRDFADLPPDQFVREVLIEKLKADQVIVGENFTYGSKAEGHATDLKKYKEFETTIVKLEENRGNPISSTRIRNLIMDGDVERAGELLTRPHYLTGPVVHGEARGREIGYPTANLGLSNLACVPADGIYAGWMSVEGVTWHSAISIGTNPTFPGIRGRQVEAYAINQIGLELYDKIAKIEFGFRLRDTLKFNSLDELLVQMKKDCEEAARLTGFSA